MREHRYRPRKVCEELSPPMVDDGFRLSCSLPVHHTGPHSIDYEGEVIEWAHHEEPHPIVPKPDLVYMPSQSSVEGGREDFWRQFGNANYLRRHALYNSDEDGNFLPWNQRRDLPDGSTWVDHLWKLTPGTKFGWATDEWTVFMAVETPVAVIIWTCEHLDLPIVFGGARRGRGGHPEGGGETSRLTIGGKALVLAIMKKLARDKGEPFNLTEYEDTFIPSWGCLS